VNEMMTEITRPHWATRREALAYAKVGATKLSELIKHRRIVAKRLDGKKILIDLNSIDRLYDSLPDGAS
jgi:hypothetical protein